MTDKLTNMFEKLAEPGSKELLVSLGNKINSKYFGGTINSDIAWIYPNKMDICSPDQFSLAFESKEFRLIKLAEDKICKAKFEEAITLLSPLAEKGSDAAQKALVQLFQRLGDDKMAEKWSKKRNKKADQVVLNFCSSIEKKSDGNWGLIKIDPYLFENANQKIISYVIYHEMLHEFFETTSTDPFPLHFKKMDSIFPYRKDAIAWLRKKRYTTIDDIYAS